MLLLDILIVNGGDNIGETLVKDIVGNCTHKNKRLFVSVQRKELFDNFYEKTDIMKSYSSLNVLYKQDNNPIPSPYNDLIDLAFTMSPPSKHFIFMDDDIVIKDFGFLEKVCEQIELNPELDILVTEHCIESAKIKNCFWVVKKKLISSIGYFDEDLIGEYACYDYIDRAMAHGFKVGVISNSLGYFDHIGGVGTSKNPKYDKMKEDSKTKYQSKTYNKSNAFKKDRINSINMVEEYFWHPGLKDEKKTRFLELMERNKAKIPDIRKFNK